MTKQMMLEKGDTSVKGDHDAHDKSLANVSSYGVLAQGGDGDEAGHDATIASHQEGVKDNAEGSALSFPDHVTDDDRLAFQTLVKKIGITMAQAQQVVDFAIKREDSYVDHFIAQQKARITAWEKDVQSHGEQMIKDARHGFSTMMHDFKYKDQLLELLKPYAKDNQEGTGLGSHPAVVALFANVGKVMKRDKFIPNKKGQESDPAHTLYPHLR